MGPDIVAHLAFVTVISNQHISPKAEYRSKSGLRRHQGNFCVLFGDVFLKLMTEAILLLFFGYALKKTESAYVRVVSKTAGSTTIHLITFLR